MSESLHVSSVSIRADDAVDRAIIEHQLEQISRSEEFARSERLRRFLKFVVEETLAGRGTQIKAYTIATAVFDRDDRFDPRVDPIVRIEAGRLRRALQHYYLTTGQDDPLLIDIPKGAYRPIFRVGTTVSPDTPPAAPASEKPSGGLRHWLLLAGALGAGAVMTGLASSLLLPPWPERTPAKVAIAQDDVLTVPAGPRVAVMRFKNLSGDSASDYFVSGMTDQIVTDLARFKALLVLAPRTGDASRNPDYRAEYVLEGGVRLIDDRVRVTVRLSDASAGMVAWVGSYERPIQPGTLFQIQDDISRQVATTIGSRYGIIAESGLSRAERRPPQSLGAYDCILRFYEFQKTGAPPQHARVRDCLERALVREPNYAEAWAALSYVYGQEHRLDFNPRPRLYDSLEKAAESARRAVELNRNSPTAHWALAAAAFDAQDLETFRVSGERALALNPNDPDLLGHYGLRLALIGEWDRGLALLTKGMTLSPEHPWWYWAPFIYYHYERHEYDLAIQIINRINSPDLYLPHVYMAMNLAQLGRTDEAKAAARRVLDLKPDFVERFWRIWTYWNIPAPLLEHVADGLRKAGLPISPAPEL